MNRLVIGCGYLGLRVAQKWLRAGDTVFAVTRSVSRSEEFKSQGITPIVADVTDYQSLNNLPAAATVLFAVGFDRGRHQDVREVYVDGFKNVLERLPGETEQLIYVSTTGVYGDHDGGWISETTTVQPSRPSSHACWLAETALKQSGWWDKSVILRLAGIYGPQRIPRLDAIRSRRWSELNADGFINLIHVDDATAIIEQVAKLGISAETFLVSDGNPPNRTEFFQYLADRLGVGKIDWPSPVETESLQRGANKRISNRKLLERTGIKLSYADFRQGVDQSLL